MVDRMVDCGVPLQDKNTAWNVVARMGGGGGGGGSASYGRYLG